MKLIAVDHMRYDEHGFDDWFISFMVYRDLLMEQTFSVRKTSDGITMSLN